MPLPAPDPDEVMPADLQQLAGYMRQSYSEATQWWEFTSSSALQDAALPDDLLDDAAAASPARWPPAPTMARATSRAMKDAASTAQRKQNHRQA